MTHSRLWSLPHAKAAARIALLLAAVGTARGEAVRLRDGLWLQGEILSHTEKEFRLRRWDSGGTITIPWEAVAPGDAARVQKKLGYVTSEDFDETISGVRVVLEDGRVFEGLLVERTPEKIVLKTTYRKIEFPLDTIQRFAGGEPMLEIEIPIGTVYSRREMYEMKAKDLAAANEAKNPAVQAQNHYQFSEWLLTYDFIEEANDHLATAAGLDSTFGARFRDKIRDVSLQLERKRIEERFELARSLARSHIFARATAELDSIEKDVSPEKLTRDVEDERDFVQREKDEYLLAEVPGRFFTELRNLSQIGAKGRSTTYAEALQFAGQMATEAFKRVAEDFEIDEKEAADYFQRRVQKKARTADFGSATFIVGTDLEDQGAGGGQGSGQGNAPPRQGGQGQGGGAQQGGDPRQAWWQNATTNTRAGFLYAFYCFSNFEIVKSSYTRCSNCSGLGVIAKMGAGVGGGTTTAVTCSRCQGQKVDRTIHFR